MITKTKYKKENTKKKTQKRNNLIGGYKLSPVILTIFFNIDDARLVAVNLKDCLGIYSTINWNSSIVYTSSNNESNDESYRNINVNTEIVKTKEYKIKKYKRNQNEFEFKIGSIISSMCSGNEFIFVGLYSKRATQYEEILIKCIIYKHVKNNYYYICFNFGQSIDFYETGKDINGQPNGKINLDLQIKKVVRYIYKELKDKVIDYVFIYGFSMGGNIAQHVVLKLLKDESQRIPENKIFLFVFSSGFDINKSDYDLLYQKLFKTGRLISYVLISSDKYNVNINNNSEQLLNNTNSANPITINIDYNFLNKLNKEDKDRFPLPTIAILIKIINVDDSNEKAEILSYYNLDEIREKEISKDIILNRTRDLHSLQFLRQAICKI